MYRIAAGAAGAHRETAEVSVRSVDEDRRRLDNNINNNNNNNNNPSTTSNDNVMLGNDPERTRRYARRRPIARHTVSVLVRAENDQSDQSLLSLL